MRQDHDGTQEVRNLAAIADICERIAEMFDRRPELAGFTIQEAASLTPDRANEPFTGSLYVADLALDTWPGYRETPVVQGEIAAVLLEAHEDHPEVFEVLRGRTFARSFH